MKASKSHEILAVVLALGGALLLGFVYYPILNPVQYRLTPGPEIALWQRYVLGTLATILMFTMAWYFNSKAGQMKRTDHK